MISAGILAQSMNGSYQRSDLLDERTRGLEAMAKQKLTPDSVKMVAKEFEALFLSQMLEHMFGESSGEELFGGEESNEIYKSMMVEQYGKSITAAGGIGIAAHIEQSLMQRQLLQTQEV